MGAVLAKTKQQLKRTEMCFLIVSAQLLSKVTHVFCPTGGCAGFYVNSGIVHIELTQTCNCSHSQVHKYVDSDNVRNLASGLCRDVIEV